MRYHPKPIISIKLDPDVITLALAINNRCFAGDIMVRFNCKFKSAYTSKLSFTEYCFNSDKEKEFFIAETRIFNNKLTDHHRQLVRDFGAQYVYYFRPPKASKEGQYREFMSFLTENGYVFSANFLNINNMHFYILMKEYDEAEIAHFNLRW